MRWLIRTCWWPVARRINAALGHEASTRRRVSKRLHAEFFFEEYARPLRRIGLSEAEILENYDETRERWHVCHARANQFQATVPTTLETEVAAGRWDGGQPIGKDIAAFKNRMNSVLRRQGPAGGADTPTGRGSRPCR